MRLSTIDIAKADGKPRVKVIALKTFSKPLIGWL